MSDFPWGDRNPPGGYEVGDRVGILFSDHDRYLFDNPVGKVVAVDFDDEDRALITVQVQADCAPEDLYLIARGEEIEA